MLHPAPEVVSQAVGVVPTKVKVEVMASPDMLLREVDAVVEMVSKSVDAVPEVGETMYINDDDDRLSQPAQTSKSTTLPKEA